MTKKKTLYPVAEPVKANPFVIILMSFLFALVFFIIGFATQHYPKLVTMI